MKKYEGLFILPPDSTPEARKTEFHRLEELLKKFGVTILQRLEIGKKSLGYSVKKFKEGFLLVLDFQMDSTRVPELRKSLELHEGLLKCMILAKDKRSLKKPRSQEAGRAPRVQAAAASPTGVSH